LYGESGKVQREPFTRIIKHFIKIKEEEINKIFYSLDAKNVGSITFEDFSELSENDSRFAILYKPNRNYRQEKSSDSS
jgi:Ca2+-binding EF-hand superfamily protein